MVTITAAGLPKEIHASVTGNAATTWSAKVGAAKRSGRQELSAIWTDSVHRTVAICAEGGGSGNAEGHATEAILEGGCTVYASDQ